MKGIYIVANDKVIDNAIALLNSIRLSDPDIPVFMIPFNDRYEQVASVLQAKHQVKLFPDLDFVEKFTNKIAEIFDRDFLALPHKMRKFVQWFGPLNEFLYIDTDIIVFEKISNILKYLNNYEFINCDYHFKSKKLRDIFSQVIQEKSIFTEQQLQDVFNSGFWGSRKGIFSEEQLYKLLDECSQHKEYFDFSQKTTDQPILNYIILKSTTKRLNLVKISENEAGSWAGSKHFQQQNHLLYDGNKPLKYIHWAGVSMKPGGPYRELWEYYRYLGEEKPRLQPRTKSLPNIWQKIINKFQ
jgi:hypothetical protein